MKKQIIIALATLLCVVVLGFAIYTYVIVSNEHEEEVLIDLVQFENDAFSIMYPSGWDITQTSYGFAAIDEKYTVYFTVEKQDGKKITSINTDSCDAFFDSIMRTYSVQDVEFTNSSVSIGIVSGKQACEFKTSSKVGEMEETTLAYLVLAEDQTEYIISGNRVMSSDGTVALTEKEVEYVLKTFTLK